MQCHCLQTEFSVVLTSLRNCLPIQKSGASASDWWSLDSVPITDLQRRLGDVNFWNFLNASKMMIVFCFSPEATRGGDF